MVDVIELIARSFNMPRDRRRQRSHSTITMYTSEPVICQAGHSVPSMCHMPRQPTAETFSCPTVVDVGRVLL